jgi:hypothetical protein
VAGEPKLMDSAAAGRDHQEDEDANNGPFFKEGRDGSFGEYGGTLMSVPRKPRRLACGK